MSMTKEYKDYILEQLCDLKLLSKPMMGGYLFYYENTYFGGIYENDNFLIKKSKNNQSFGLKEEIPYKGAKPMFLIEDLEDISFIEQVIQTTVNDLKK